MAYASFYHCFWKGVKILTEADFFLNQLVNNGGYLLFYINRNLKLTHHLLIEQGLRNNW